LGIFELCPWKPDVVVSGINEGLNAGTNVNFSGTVAGAMTAAALGFKSISISLESSAKQKFAVAAESAWCRWKWRRASF
jgi:5'-nucleotidase